LPDVLLRVGANPFSPIAASNCALVWVVYKRTLPCNRPISLALAEPEAAAQRRDGAPEGCEEKASFHGGHELRIDTPAGNE